MKTRVIGLVIALLAAASLTGCSTEGTTKTRLDFFQFKGEAVEQFTALVAAFEAQNPDIDVVINNAPDADTAIRTLLVKGKTPDVITLNGSGNFAQLAKACVFYDFTGDALLDQINPAPLAIVNGLGTCHDSEINSLPYISNADGILYNRQIFAEQGLAIPTTFAELVEVCEKLQAAGITPFYATLADAWTVLPSLNGLGAYATKDGLLDRMKLAGAQFEPGSADSFQGGFGTVLERQSQLMNYTNQNRHGRTYDDGNAAMANGEAAMLMQGIWAIPMIRAINPDIDLGMFAYPWDDPQERVVVSGVDLTITIARDTPHLAEAKRFVEFLFRAENSETLAADLAMFSCAAATPGSADSTLAEVQSYFDQGQIAPFLDHQVPAAIPLQQTDQQFLYDSNAQNALATLDSEWAKYARRTDH